MTWIFYALASIAIGSFINILQRVLMKDKDSNPLPYAIALQLSGGLICLLFAIVKGFKMPPIREYPFNFALLTIFYASTTWLSFKALKLIEASKTTIILSFSSVVAIIASAVFLKEALTSLRLLGTLLIIISIILVAELKNFSMSKGVFYALLSAVLAGLALVNDTYLLRFSDTISYTAIGFLLPGILLSLLYPKSLKKLKTFLKPKPLKNMFFLAFAWAISAITFYLAIEKGALISQLSPISQSRIILTVLLAVILLKEKDNLPVKIGAAFLTMLGVMLIK